MRNNNEDSASSEAPTFGKGIEIGKKDVNTAWYVVESVIRQLVVVNSQKSQEQSRAKS